MLNLTLLRQDTRRSWRILFLFTVLMIACEVILLSFYDPVQGLKDTAWLDAMPARLVEALGIDLADGSLTGYISSYLFGFCYLLLPLIFTVVLGNVLVTYPTQNGMMAYDLSLPEPRGTVIFGKIYLILMELFGMFLISGAAGMVFCALVYPGKLEIPQYILLWLGAYVLHLCLGGIAFLAACICNELKTSLMIGAGLAVLFLVAHMLGRMGGSLEFLCHVTPFALFCPGELLDGSWTLYWKLPAAVFIGILCFFVGGKVFEKKDLPL